MCAVCSCGLSEMEAFARFYRSVDFSPRLIVLLLFLVSYVRVSSRKNYRSTTTSSNQFLLSRKKKLAQLNDNTINVWIILIFICCFLVQFTKQQHFLQLESVKTGCFVVSTANALCAFALFVSYIEPRCRCTLPNSICDFPFPFCLGRTGQK